MRPFFARLLSACTRVVLFLLICLAFGAFSGNTAVPPTTRSTDSPTSPANAVAAAPTAAPTATPAPLPTPAPSPSPLAPLESLAQGLIAFASNRVDHLELYLYDAGRRESIQWMADDNPKRGPVWAPDGRTLAYAAQRNGAWQIYKRSLSGGPEIPLTSPPGDNYEPAWSPDGKAIAFTSNRDGHEQVYVVDSEGRNVRNLSRNGDSDFRPSWSPDGKLLAFATNREGNWQIYLMNADGSNPRNISRSVAGDWSPVWSPDGRRLAFVSDRDGKESIYLSNVDGTGAISLTQGVAGDWSPVWSPDGQRLAFASKRDGNFDVYTMRADGTDVQQVTTDPGDDLDPAWRREPGPYPLSTVQAITGTARPYDQGPPLVTLWHFDDNSQIDGMRSSALYTLGQREAGYPTPHGTVFGFEPGDLYQQIYVRDTSWIDIAAMYFYPPTYVRDTIEEFLRRQYTAAQPIRPDATTFPGEGAISGLFSPSILYDKHTTTSDEEANLIRAAYTYYSMSGDRQWLQKDIDGTTVIDRLNRAMEWLLSHRHDSLTGLIYRAHTTDWGDVKIEKTGSPTELEPGDALTVSIYDQAIVYQALIDLAQMNEAVGNTTESDRYTALAQELQVKSEQYLWQPVQGFYRTHWHITPLVHTNFDEDAIVSIANALTIYTGLSDHTGVFDKLQQATQAVGAIKPGLSLYPPYPTGVFAYVQMAEGQYQNGGLWDWWGGTQITAEFEHGLSDRATTHLYAVASDWARHPRDIFEWQVPLTGTNRGSDNYGASAATMVEAVVRGLYGITVGPQGVQVAPRLAAHGGWIRAYIPASGLLVSYQYHLSGQTIELQYNSNTDRDILFNPTLPQAARAARVTIDGQAVSFQPNHLNEDDSVSFTGPAGSHTINITLSSRP